MNLPISHDPLSILKQCRCFDQLNAEEVQTLKNITSIDQLKTIEVVGTWIDDHLPCVGVKLNDLGLAFVWIGDPEYAGAFYYPDSAIAKGKILEMLKEQIRIHCSEEEEYPTPYRNKYEYDLIVSHINAQSTLGTAMQKEPAIGMELCWQASAPGTGYTKERIIAIEEVDGKKVVIAELIESTVRELEPWEVV